MKAFQIIPAKTDAQLRQVAVLAEEIWNQHFTDIIGKEQVDYMVEKFQSFQALKEQVAGGYEYFQLFAGDTFCGYTGVHDEDGTLFLSKLYIRADARGQHLSSRAFQFLKDLCKERGLSKIWLTCNKNNEHTLAVYDHFGFTVASEKKADIGNGFFMDDYILEYEITP